MKSSSGTIDNITKTIHIHTALSEIMAKAAALAAYDEMFKFLLFFP
jgi:hypothetical protein